MKFPRDLKVSKARQDVRKLLPPELVEKTLLDVQAGRMPKRCAIRHFQFVLVDLKETLPSEISAAVGRVVDAFFRHGALLSNVTPSLVVGYLGIPNSNSKSDSVEARLSLVAALLSENGDSIRVMHGQCDGVAGNLGSRGRWIYGAIIPGFSEILRKLLAAQFGTSREVS
jgi:hypothetical protein